MLRVVLVLLVALVVLFVLGLLVRGAILLGIPSGLVLFHISGLGFLCIPGLGLVGSRSDVLRHLLRIPSLGGLLGLLGALLRGGSCIGRPRSLLRRFV